MILSNAKIRYQIAGGWSEINELKSCDVSYTTSGTRNNWDRKGIYTNEVIDSIELNFERGKNEALDGLGLQSEIALQWNNGASIMTGTFVVNNKINKKENGTTVTFVSFIPKLGEEITVKSTASGAISGVQDVEVNGKSVVDTDTGIANVDTSNLTTSEQFKTAVEEVTKELQDLNTYCDDLDATKAAQSDLDDEIQVRTDEDNAIRDLLADKADAVNYIQLTGAYGTLTTEQRATLLKGSATLNFIDKDGMIFKCVFYSAGKKAVYSIGGESKIHVIEVTLPSGDWVLTTYNLAQPYTAGEGIEIKNNVISAKAGETLWSVDGDAVKTEKNDVKCVNDEQVFEIVPFISVNEKTEEPNPKAGNIYYVYNDDKYYEIVTDDVWPTDALEVSAFYHESEVPVGTEGFVTFTSEASPNLYYTSRRTGEVSLKNTAEIVETLATEVPNKQEKLTAGTDLEIDETHPESPVINFTGATIKKDTDGVYVEFKE